MEPAESFPVIAPAVLEGMFLRPLLWVIFRSRPNASNLMPNTLHSEDDDATAYARGVLSGLLPAGPYVHGACQRHLAFLATQGTAAFPYLWEPFILEDIVEFAAMLNHYKGEFAGRPIIVMPWQRFILGSIFCWVHRTTGLRMVRDAYVEVPRKNAKSALAAIVCLWMLLMDGEEGAEVYTCATKKDQAKLVYTDALKFMPPAMAKKHLRTVGGVTHHISSNSKMMPLGRDSDTLDGLNPHLGVADEVHEMKDGSLIAVIENGMGARRQPLLFKITTAGHNKRGPAWGFRETAISLAEDAGRRDFVFDSFFGYVACPADSDRENWRERRVWEVANPGLGITKYLAWMSEQAEKAEKTPNALGEFLNKQLNFWTDAASRWISSDQWNAGSTDREALLGLCAGQKCFAGLDLAQTTDLSAFCLLFPPTGDRTKWVALWWHWCPEDKATNKTKSDRVPYLEWARSGLIKLTPGNATDFSIIRADILEICADYQVQSVAFDRWNAGETVQYLMNEGLTMLAHGQGYVSMSPPSKEIERKFLAGEILHDGNQLLGWQSSNVVVSRDASGNVKPDKEKSANKIDGIVALVMAQGAAMSIVQKEFRGMVCAAL